MALSVIVTNRAAVKPTRENNKILARTAVPKKGADPFAPQTEAQKIAYAEKAEAIAVAEEALVKAINSKDARRDDIMAKEKSLRDAQMREEPAPESQDSDY